MKTMNFSKTTTYNRGLEISSKIVYWISWVLLWIQTISLLVIPIYMLLTAFKSSNLEVVRNPFGFPKTLVWKNFTVIFTVIEEKLQLSVTNMLGVSFIMSTVPQILILFFTTCFAYVEAKYDFIGKKFFFNFGIILMIIPIVGNTAASMQIRKALHVYDNLFLHIMVSPSGCFSGMNFLMLYAAFKVLPWDYAESVFIDGGNSYTVFFKIYLPMVLPQVFAFFVLGFMAAWNDYSTYMVWLPSTPNVSYGMYLFNLRANQFRMTQPELMAGFTIVMIPTAILYILTQNLITSKLLVGGLKG